MKDIAQRAVKRFCLPQHRIIADIIDMRLTDPVLFIPGNPADIDSHVLPIVRIRQGFLRFCLKGLCQKLLEIAAERIPCIPEICICLGHILCSGAPHLSYVSIIFEKERNIRPVKTEKRRRGFGNHVDTF